MIHTSLEIEGEILSRSLKKYIREVWKIVEPATPFVPGRHIDVICDHLEAVTRGEIPELLINMPPRHMKSLLVSVFWPTWVWTFWPSSRWIFTSYAKDLATRDSLKCRRIIESPWYQKRWGWKFRLTGDQNVKTRFENDRTGYRISSSVDSANTGEGGHFVVCDDPHNVREAESDAVRESTLTWWREAMATRWCDPKRFSRIVVGQRTHQYDLSGALIENGGVCLLSLPAEYEENDKPNSFGWRDWRKISGELLWPQMFSKEALRIVEKKLLEYAYAAQFQQRPVPRGGGIFKEAWFRIVDTLPANIYRTVRYWDLAATAETATNNPCYTCGVKEGITDKNLLVIQDSRRAQLEPADVEIFVGNTASQDGPEVEQHLEQEGGSGGKNTVSHYVRNVLFGYAVFGDPVTKVAKEERWKPYAAQLKVGNVVLVKGRWNEAFINEHILAPKGKFKDQIDAGAGATKVLIMEAGELEAVGESERQAKELLRGFERPTGARELTQSFKRSFGL